jgi:hypothetical protein
MVPCVGGVLPASTVYTSYAPAYSMPPQMMPAVNPAPQGNAYQYPTVWSGDNVLSGGQLEWAAEDSAQHALNLDNWRIKILESKRRQAELQAEIREASTAAGLQSSPMALSQQEGPTELSEIKHQIATLARGTEEAVDAMQKEVTFDSPCLEKSSFESFPHQPAKAGRIFPELQVWYQSIVHEHGIRL